MNQLSIFLGLSFLYTYPLKQMHSKPIIGFSLFSLNQCFSSGSHYLDFTDKTCSDLPTQSICHYSKCESDHVMILQWLTTAIKENVNFMRTIFLFPFIYYINFCLILLVNTHIHTSQVKLPPTPLLINIFSGWGVGEIAWF